MLRASMAVALLFVAAMAVPSAAANAESAKKCYRVECSGTTGICISLSVDPCGDVAVTIPGVASVEEVPCPSAHQGSYSDCWVADPEGAWGIIDGNAAVVGSTVYITEYEESTYTTDYETWNACRTGLE